MKSFLSPSLTSKVRSRLLVLCTVTATLALSGVQSNAAILLVGDYTSAGSKDLSYSSNGFVVPTVAGSSVAQTASGYFGGGVNIASGGGANSNLLQYNVSGSSFNSNTGTISFFYKPGVAVGSYSDLRILTVMTSGGARLADIYYSGGGSFDSYQASNGESSFTPALTWGANDWLYFAFEWDATSGIHTLWGGNASTGTVAGNERGNLVGVPYTPSGAGATLNVGSFDGTDGSDNFSYGTWDNIAITDNLLYGTPVYSPAVGFEGYMHAESITIPTSPVSVPVPEPSSMVSAILGAIALFVRNRTSRRVRVRQLSGVFSV